MQSWAAPEHGLNKAAPSTHRRRFGSSSARKCSLTLRSVIFTSKTLGCLCATARTCAQCRSCLKSEVKPFWRGPCRAKCHSAGWAEKAARLGSLHPAALEIQRAPKVITLRHGQPELAGRSHPAQPCHVQVREEQLQQVGRAADRVHRRLAHWQGIGSVLLLLAAGASCRRSCPHPPVAA